MSYSELPEFVLKRSNPDEHAKIDCDFVIDGRWHNECRPIFFYGIAHILKHQARNIAYNIREQLPVGGATGATLSTAAQGNCAHNIQSKQAKNDNSSKKLEEKMIALYRTVGWADEFFWLSTWSHQGNLEGPPKWQKIDDPYKMLLEVLVHMEWGDLLRDAWFYHRNDIVTSRKSDDHEDAGRFESWQFGGEYSNIKDALFCRAKARFNEAEKGLDQLEALIRNDSEILQCFDSVIKVIKRNLYFGYGRIYHANSDDGLPEAYFKKAQRLDIGANDERTIADRLFRAATTQIKDDLDNLSFNFFYPKEKSYQNIHILAGWIEDLLLDKENGTLHPRTPLPVPEDPKRENYITSIPNPTMIHRLEELLRKHRDWLRFVTDDREKDNIGFRNAMETIEKQDSNLRNAMFKSKKENDIDVSSWELFILRDWGSYTPILPLILRQVSPDYSESNHTLEGNQGGGGYFLRCGKCGIVIDPGFNYIEHFFEAGLSPDEITHIIVTHDHYDHAASFGPLLNLLFQFNENRKNNQESTQNVDFLLCRGTLDQYARFIVDYKYYGNIVPLTDRDGKMGKEHILSETEPSIMLHTTHTEHALDDGFGKGVGLIFKFGEKLETLGITSDTGWYSQYMLGKKLEKMSLGETFQEHSPGVLVLHVGSLKQDELRNSGFYKTHLGARGVFLSIDEIKECKLAILSEFGEECRGYRRWFANRVDRYFKEQKERHNFRCFPSDRKTRIIARNGDLFISRYDDNTNLVPYEHAEVQKASDGSFKFIDGR